MWLAALKTLWHRVSRANRLIETYRIAAQGTSDHGLAHVNWGVALAELGELQESLGKFERATQLSAHRAEPWINWGVALAKLARFNEAIEKFDRASQIEPDRGSTYMLWGAALVELGDIEQAGPLYERAIGLNPRHPEPWINWAIALARHGQYDAAIERLKKALTFKPSQPQVQFLLGAVLAECGHYSAAIDRFEQAVKLSPKHDEALYFWAVSLHRLDSTDPARASEKIRQALQLNPDRADYYICLGDILTSQDKLDLAAVNYRHAVGLAPRRADACLSLGKALCQLGRHSDGRQQFARAQGLCPDQPGLDLTWGLSLIETGEFDDALLHLERALMLNPAGVEAMVAMARILAGQSQWDGAQMMLEQAVAQEPDHPLACSLLAQSTLEHLDLDRARHGLEQALSHGDPARMAKVGSVAGAVAGSVADSAIVAYLEAALLSALLALEADQPDHALRQLRPLLRQRPDCPRVLSGYVLALLAAGDIRDAQHKLGTFCAVADSSARSMASYSQNAGRGFRTDVDAHYPALASLEIALCEHQLERAHSLWQDLSAFDQLPLVAFWLSARLALAQLAVAGDQDVAGESLRLKEIALTRLEQTLRHLPTCGEAWQHWLTLQRNSVSSPEAVWVASAQRILASGNAPWPARQAVFAGACVQVWGPGVGTQLPGLSEGFPWLGRAVEQGLLSPGLNGYLLWRPQPWLR